MTKTNLITIFQLAIPSLQKELRDINFDLLEDKDEFQTFQLINNLFVKAILSDRLGQDIDDADIVRQHYGKPVLANSFNRGIHFNKSHTNKLIALGIAPIPIGLDIEVTQPDFSDAILKKITHENDHYTVNTTEDFYKYWTIKESFVKWQGRGLQSPLNEVEIERKIGNDYIVSSDNCRTIVREINFELKCNCFVTFDHSIDCDIEVIPLEKSHSILLEYIMRKSSKSIEIP